MSDERLFLMLRRLSLIAHLSSLIIQKGEPP
jgi:hypothetical protein